MKLQMLQILLRHSQDHGRLPDKCISKHSYQWMNRDCSQNQSKTRIWRIRFRRQRLKLVSRQHNVQTLFCGGSARIHLLGHRLTRCDLHVCRQPVQRHVLHYSSEPPVMALSNVFLYNVLPSCRCLWTRVLASSSSPSRRPSESFEPCALLSTNTETTELIRALQTRHTPLLPVWIWQLSWWWNSANWWSCSG